MRILQLGSVAPPHGGVQSNVTAIRERLQQRGDSCAVIAITRSSEIRSEPEVFHPQSAFELLRLISTVQSDLIHLHIGGNFTLRLAALAFVCGLIPGRKKVLTFHSGGYASSPLGKAAKSLSVRGFAVRRFDKIIAVNAEIADVFERYGVAPEKITIISPNVLRQPDESVKIPAHLLNFAEKHSPLLISVGLLETLYDLPLQIRAMNSVLQEFPNAGLLLVGSGIEEENLRREIAAQNYADNILLAGDVAHEIVLHLINRADALLRTTIFDGDAISVREALFLETPVIATDNKMRPPGVRLIKIGDGDDLAKVILETLRQPKKTKINQTADWSNIDAVLRVYEELLERKAEAPVSQIQNLKSKI